MWLCRGGCKGGDAWGWLGEAQGGAGVEVTGFIIVQIKHGQCYNTLGVINIKCMYLYVQCSS